MKREALLVLSALILILGAGCRASLIGRQVSTPPTSGGEKVGLIYYLTTPVFAIDVKDRHDNKKAQPVYEIKVASTADLDPNRRFSVRLEGGTITKDVVSLKLRPDGTLASFGAASESQVPQLIASLGNLAASGLTFGTLGVGAATANLDRGDDLDAAFACVPAASAQELTDARCVAGSLADSEANCEAIPCEGQLSQDANAKQLIESRDQSERILDIVRRLIKHHEGELWNALSDSQATPEVVTDRVNSRNQILSTLRGVEEKLANRLGVDPQYETLAAPQSERLLGIVRRLIKHHEEALWTALSDSQATPEVVADRVNSRNQTLSTLRGIEEKLANRLGVDPHERLAASQSERLLGIVRRLIKYHEQVLWTDLSTPNATSEDLSSKIKNRNNLLSNLRSIEEKLADQLGVDLQHESLSAPDPKISAAAIEKNLTTLIRTQLDTWRGASEGDKDEAFKLLLVFSNIADTFGLEGRLEKRIAERFAKGELATVQKAQEGEKHALAEYRIVAILRELRSHAVTPPTPRDRIAKSLARKKSRVEQLYARFISDPSVEAPFRRALSDYSDAVERFLALDDRLGATTLQERRKQLLPFIARPIPGSVTGNETKAYRDLREELDRVFTEIGSRVGSAVDAKKPDEPLPLGTQVTRTLDQIVSCVFGPRDQLFDKHDELPLLAEMWTQYGGREGVVFRRRSTSVNNRLDCGIGEPFGASVRVRLDAEAAQAKADKAPGGNGVDENQEEENASSPRRSYRLRSGMHARRLTSKDLDSGTARIEGVVVQLPVAYEIYAVLLGPSQKRIIETATLNLPADDEFLDLSFKGGMFRSQELSVSLHANGALDEYKLDSVQTASASAQSLADATKAVTTSLLEIEKAQPAAVNPLETENNQVTLEILNLMLQENLKALQEGRPLPFPQLFD